MDDPEQKKRKTREVQSRYLQTPSIKPTATPLPTKNTTNSTTTNSNAPIVNRSKYGNPSGSSLKNSEFVTPQVNRISTIQTKDVSMTQTSKRNPSTFSTKTPRESINFTETTKSLAPAIQLSDEIFLYRTRLLQWTFLNVKFTHCFQLQKQDAKKRLYLAWNHIQNEKQKRIQQETSIVNKKRILETETIMEKKMKELSYLQNQFINFKGKYDLLSKSLIEIANRMPITNILDCDLSDISQSLLQCQNILQSIENCGFNNLETFDTLLHSLKLSIEEISIEFEECAQLLQELEELGRIERNLKVFEIQLCK